MVLPLDLVAELFDINFVLDAPVAFWF